MSRLSRLRASYILLQLRQHLSGRQYPRLFSSQTKMTSNNTHSTLLPAGSEPAFIYGTAWKKDETSRLVKEALTAGFRGIDTAAQPRHYREELVGIALREAFKEGKIQRSDIYVRN